MSGQIFSVNDARFFDWPERLRRYIDTVRQGKCRYPKKYSTRYICSLVADLHRTLMYGGVAMNPRGHLRLVYEANPLSFLVGQAGAKVLMVKEGFFQFNQLSCIKDFISFLEVENWIGSLEYMEEL